jgi:hypothetical protein
MQDDLRDLAFEAGEAREFVNVPEIIHDDITGDKMPGTR